MIVNPQFFPFAFAFLGLTFIVIFYYLTLISVVNISI